MVEDVSEDIFECAAGAICCRSLTARRGGAGYLKGVYKTTVLRTILKSDGARTEFEMTINIRQYRRDDKCRQRAKHANYSQI